MSFIGKRTTYLDFGAIKLNPFPKPSPCGVNLNFCQPTEQFDDIKFQFLASESTELITNPTFTASTSGWITTGWGLVLDGTNFIICQFDALNALSQQGILTIGDFFKVTVTVSNFSGGTLLVGGGTGSAIFNGVLTIQSNGTFTGFFQYTEAGAGDFIIQGTNTAIGVCVDDISVIKIADPSDYTIQIHDAVTFVLIDTVPAANITAVENILTVDFNWTDDLSIPNGCVVIRIFDGSDIFEDTFGTNQGWTLADDILITGGLMTFTSTGVQRIATIDDIFVVGETYTITFTTSGVTGTGTVQVRCGRTTGTIRSTNGTFVETLLCTDITTLQFFFTGAALSTVSVDNVQIKKEDNLDAQSECLELETTHDCTLLWVWSNKETWGGFDYSTGFEHNLRVTCKFRGTAYPVDQNIGEDSAGVRSVDYVSLRKISILDIDFAADHIHDAIAAHFAQDNRAIDGVSFILDEEYEPSAPNDSKVVFKDLMTATIELEKSDQPDLINRNVS